MKKKNKEMQVITAMRPMPKEFAEIDNKIRELHIEMASKALYHLISKKPFKNSSLDIMCEFLNWDFERKGIFAKAVPNYEKNEVEIEYYEREVKVGITINTEDIHKNAD